MTTDPGVRVLRALSGISRASRDVDALAEALEGHNGSIAQEMGAELAFLTRRAAILAKLMGMDPRAIEHAKAP